MRTIARPMRRIAAVSLLALTLVASAGLSRAQEASLEDAQNELDTLKGDLGAAIDRYNEVLDELEDIQARRMVINHEVEQIAKNMLTLEDHVEAGPGEALAHDFLVLGEPFLFEGMDEALELGPGQVRENRERPERLDQLVTVHVAEIMGEFLAF